jgi:hypothetical protein
MPSIKVANPTVSNALLKALGNDAKGKPQISNIEWSNIKKTATGEIKASGNPARTLKTVAASFELADRVTGGKYKEKFGELVKGPLADVAETRKANLRQVDAGNWGHTGDSGGTSGTPT